MSTSQDFRQPARPRITVDDEEISDLYVYLVNARVDLARKKPAMCTLTFDTVRLDDGTWAVQDSGFFEPWKSFLIEADFGEYREEVMRGYVKTVQADSPEQMGEAKVTVVCQDETIVLDREHTRKTWSLEDEVMSDGDIAREIAGASNLDVDADDGLTNISLYQDSTNIRFLRDRAEANGYDLYTREGTLYIKPPQVDEDPQASIMVYSGPKTNCNQVSVQYDGHRPDQVGVVRGAATGTELEQETLGPDLTVLGRKAANSEEAGLSPFVWQMQRPAGSSMEEAIARAQAKANENAWKLRAQGELDGSLYGHVLLNHKPVGVYGIGDTYSGVYYVDSVVHIFDQAGYRQAFNLLRNATGQDSEPDDGDALAAVR